MQPNIPIRYSTLAEYIEAIAGSKVAVLSGTVDATFAAVQASITTLQNAVADINQLNANISANADVVANTAHRLTVAGNPHQVTKTEIGLGNVPNYDFTVEMQINNAKVGITPEQAAAIIANTAKVGITVQQAADIVSANTHRAIITGNPHQVTKAEVGLSNVPNINCTNASNITTGTLPTSVLPPLAITDTYTVASEAAQLALTIQKGDIAVRTDLNRSFVNSTGGNSAMTDWQELYTPTDTILSVNSKVGVVILTTSDIAEGTNLYYTEARVAANTEVALNTANRHAHSNKAILDGTTATFTTARNNEITAATTHRNTVTGNPHQVTKAEVGLGNVPNYDFTAEMTANNAKVGITPEQAADIVAANVHRLTTTGNPHLVTKAEVGLGLVPNTNFTTPVANATAHIATVTGNPHAVTKTDVGLSNVPNYDFTAEMAVNNAKVGITPAQAAAIVANTAKVGITTQQAADIVSANDHRANTTNPHSVTKAQVGLGNVPNVDCTNASNITTGTLPSSVLPPIAIVDTYVVVSEAAQLALTVQKGDIAVRSDLNRTYINKTGLNTAMTDWQELYTPTDTILSVNGFTGTVVLTTTNIAEGTNKYYTEARVNANVNVAANTVARHTHANKTTLDAVTAAFTTEQAAAIVANTAKVGITSEQAAAIVANTAKVGITTQQAADIVSNNNHRATILGNPHQVTKADVGLGSVPNTDFTSAVAANTAHRGIVTGNPHGVTKAEVGLSNVPNTNFTTPVANATAHIAVVTGNPHQVTKAEVGLGNVPNYDFTAEMNANNAKVGITVDQAADIVLANSHRANTSNPHAVTKTQIGLGNVPNVNCTNASNITTGMLPSSVIPPVAITDTFVVASEAAQLALTVERGDIAVRSDLNRTYVNKLSANSSMADWQELLTPTDTILSVNGQTGSVVLSTSNIAEGSNLYYTEDRVTNNANVALNTANRHTHGNKTILDNTTASYTTGLNTTLTACNTHRNTVTGNPHNVTKAEVGLGNVPNYDFTAEMNANNAKVGITTQQAADIVSANTHRATVTGNPHAVTKAEVGLGNVPNTDFTAAVASNTAHRNIVTGNPHQVTKAEVGLGLVPNTDFTAAVAANTAKVGITPAQAAAIVANTAKVGITTQQSADIVSANDHRAIISGNPHAVTKAEVGLGNVPNIDCTNASNITTGTLPTSVLPPLAITDTHVVANEAAQLALVVQKGDIAVRTDLGRSYINKTGNNTAMTDWQELMTPTDSVLSVNGFTGTVVLTTANIAESVNLYFTQARVTANTNVAANTAARHTHTNKTILDGTEESFTTVLKNNILANNDKVGITVDQAAAIVANTAKVGITTQQATDILANNAHRATVTGNPHAVTKAQVGLGSVPNTDFTAAVAANTTHRGIITGNPHQVTKAEVGLGNVPNTNFTTDVTNLLAHAATVTGNPHAVTKAQVGLGNVPNYDFTAEMAANNAKVGITSQQAADIVSANDHRANTSNPHAVTKAQVGLSLVPNVDCTNASNITTGTLPSSVLPALAITDTFIVANQLEMLALDAQKGDIAVRTDLNITYINRTGVNNAMSDWHQLATPTDLVLSVNGQVGTIVLTTSNIAEGSNLYYTEARVQANVDVAANTAARHTHTNKAILDATTAIFTTARNTIITNANTHMATVTGNPHQVTKAEVGLGNVPNTNFTVDVANSVAHIGTVTGNPHQVTKAEVGLGNVPNYDFTAEMTANNAKVGITPEQAAAIVLNTAKVGITTAQANDIVSANTHRASTNNPHSVTKTQVGLGNVPNTDFTAAVAANTAKVGITTQQAADIVSANSHRAIVSGNPHAVTKAEVGLGLVPNTDFTVPVANATSHIANTTNPHAVTKAQVGLGLVPNVDCTNASNITTGTLPTSVLPALAIVDTHVVADQTAQLALTVQKGDIAVRTDQGRSYINKTGANASMADWQELLTPTDTILTVNGQTGTVVLTTTNIAEGTNKYYTEARVNANVNVAANTAARHTHANKTILDATQESFTTTLLQAINTNSAKVGITTQQASDIEAANSHRAIVAGNPHMVTKAEVGLGNVPNTDFTSSVQAHTAHVNTVTGNPHAVTKADVGLGLVPNTNFTSAVASNTAHRGIVTGNPHNVTKAEVGLGNVPNYDFTAEMTANNAKVGITTQQAADIVSNNAHRAIVTGNPHQVTKAEVGLGNVPNTDFTAEVSANTTARHTHSNKAILDATTVSFTTARNNAITTATTHVNITSGNPHGITPLMIGAETPADAQIKANIAENNANIYTDSFMTKAPKGTLFEAILRNSIAIDKGVGTVNFTRESAATHLDRYGILRESAVDTPRFDRSGLLIEGESTNYFVGSKNANVFDKTNCRVELDKRFDAQFETTVDIITIDLPGQAWKLSKVIDTYYLEKDKYVTFSLRLNSLTALPVTITIEDSSGLNPGILGTKDLVLNEGLSRYDVTAFIANATTGFPKVSVIPTATADGSSFGIVDMQVEPLPFASSVIETTTAVVTRKADRVTIPYVENFPGSLSDKTVVMDVDVIGTTDSEYRCFTSGDLQMYVSNGTPGNHMTKVSMGYGRETAWVEKIGAFRFGVTYNKTTGDLKMFHDGVLVATKAGVTSADPPLANVGSYEQFMRDIYPTLNPSSYGTAILQIPLDILQSEIRFDSGNPFMAISRVLIVDQCLTDKEMLTA
jgi:trimeric autotransporter adhesin